MNRFSRIGAGCLGANLHQAKDFWVFMIYASRPCGLVYILFWMVIVLLAVTGLFSYKQYNVLPTNSIFEALLLLGAAVLIAKPNAQMLPYFVFSALYVAGSFVLMMVYNKSNMLDFAQAYKAFFYVIPLTFYLNRRVFDLPKATTLVKFLIVMFLAKYSYSIAFDFDYKLAQRPGIFFENNFELIFLIMLTYGLKDGFSRSFPLWLALLTITVIISGSRSSLLALLTIYGSLYLTKFNIKAILMAFVFLLLVGATVAVFMQRMTGGIESIDRFMFLMIFLDEIQEWGVLNFIFGEFPITALSSMACAKLSLWEKSLYSFSGDGSCYSVILHSYLLRVIFDHGVVGLIFLMLFVYKIFSIKGYSRKESLTFLGILMLSSVSVSAMNSIYTALAIAILVAVNRRKTIGQAQTKSSQSVSVERCLSPGP